MQAYYRPGNVFERYPQFYQQQIIIRRTKSNDKSSIKNKKDQSHKLHARQQQNSINNRITDKNRNGRGISLNDHYYMHSLNTIKTVRPAPIQQWKSATLPYMHMQQSQSISPEVNEHNNNGNNRVPGASMTETQYIYRSQLSRTSPINTNSSKKHSSSSQYHYGIIQPSDINRVANNDIINNTVISNLSQVQAQNMMLHQQVYKILLQNQQNNGSNPNHDSILSKLYELHQQQQKIQQLMRTIHKNNEKIEKKKKIRQQLQIRIKNIVSVDKRINYILQSIQSDQNNHQSRSKNINNILLIAKEAMEKGQDRGVIIALLKNVFK